MNTKTFNENYELQTSSKGVRARAKNPAADLPDAMTADAQPFDPNQTYFFFDESGAAVRQTIGMRRDGEFVSACGLKIIEISRLRAGRDDALADGQRFFRSQIEILKSKIKDYEIEKSTKSRSLKSYLMARE